MTENYFCTCHKSNRKHNQHLQLLFFKINLHSGTSNQISTYGKPNLLLINSNYLVFFSLEIQKRFMDSCRPIRILQVLYFVWKKKNKKKQTLTHKPSKVACTEKCFFKCVCYWYNTLQWIFFVSYDNGKTITAWKVSVFGVFLVRVFPHLDWIRRDTF